MSSPSNYVSGLSLRKDTGPPNNWEKTWGHSMASLCQGTQLYLSLASVKRDAYGLKSVGRLRNFRFSQMRLVSQWPSAVDPLKIPSLHPCPALTGNLRCVPRMSRNKQALQVSSCQEAKSCFAVGLWVSCGIILNYIGSHLFSTDALSWEVYRAASILLRKQLKISYSLTDLQSSEKWPKKQGVWATVGRGQLWAEDTMIVAEILDHGLWGTLL